MRPEGKNDTRPELSVRGRKVLFAVVSEFIATGEPVGSASIVNRYGLDVSSATIRSELAELERNGFLTQPHTSAGRTPSQMGLRAFIDALARVREVSDEQKQQIRNRVGSLRPGIDDVAKETGKLLASMTGVAAVVTRPKLNHERLLQLRFMPLQRGAVLAVLVTRGGIIENRVVALENVPTEAEFVRINNLIAELGNGLSLTELRDSVRRDAERSRGEVEATHQFVLNMVAATEALGETQSAGLVVEGQASLLASPEFRDPKKLQALLVALEDRERLLEFLERTLGTATVRSLANENQGDVEVLLGHETHLRVDDISLIRADYSNGGELSGTIGLVGPSRIDYAALMPLVGYTARVVGEVLARDGDDGNKGD